MIDNERQPAARLLVVDDEQALMQALVEALELQGYDATGLESGPAALKALRGGSYDVLLTDLMMPGLDGIALLRAGLALDPNLVGLIMTGKGTVPTAVEALKVGAFDYLLKPFNLDNMLQTVERALQLRRARLENLQLREAAALYDLSQSIAVELDAGAVAQQMAAAARAQLAADETAVLTLTSGAEPPAEAGAEALVVAAASGSRGPERVGQHVPLTASLAGWIAGPAEPLVLNGTVNDPRFAPLFPWPEIASAIAMPMIAGGRVVGVLTVSARDPHPPFTPGQVKALSILANAGAAALENATLVSKLRASEANYQELFEASPVSLWLEDFSAVKQRLEAVRQTGVTDFAAFLDSHPEFVAECATQVRILDVNSATLSLFGASDKHELTQNLDRILGPDAHDDWRSELLRIAQGETNFVKDSRNYNLRGDRMYVRLQWSAAPGHQDDLSRVIISLTDVTENMLADQALRESEARFVALFRASPAATTLTTLAEGRFVDVNTRFERLLDFRRDEVIGRTVAEVGTWADLQKRQQLLEALAQTGAVYDREHRLRRKSGEVIDVLLSAEVVELGGKQYMVSQVLDITERKRAEQALRASEARFAALFQANPAAITVSSTDGRILDVNAEFERSMGYPRTEVINRSASELGLWAQPAERDRVMGLLAERGSLAGLEVQYRRRSGEIMEALSSFERVEVGGQQLIMTLALDITDRNRTEDQMRFQARLLGAVGQAVIATDPEGTILYWNQAAEQIYGWPAGEVLGRNASLITPSTAQAEAVADIWARVQAGETWTGECIVQRRDGSTFTALVTDTPFYDRQSTLAGIIGLSTDISESKQRQREVEAVAALSAALRGALTRAQIQTVILDQLMALLQAEAASLTMVDAVAGNMAVEQSRGRWAPFAGARSTLEQGIVGRVAATNEPYVTDDVSNDPLIWPREAAVGIRAAAAMPLVAHGQSLGVLTVGRPESFGEGDLRLLRSMADISANALQRATLHEQTRLRAEQLAAVNELARALAETLQLEQIYARLEAATRHLLPGVSTVVISRYDAELQLLVDVYRAEGGVPQVGAGAPRSPETEPMDTATIQAQAEVLHTRRPVTVNPTAGQARARASLFAPLLAKGSVTGVLQARSAGAGRFGPDEAELLATVANTAAVSIENARLFAETQRRLLRLQSLRTIDLAISSSMDAQISLRVLVDQAATHLEVDAVGVLLLDKESRRLELAAAHGFRTPSPRLSLRLDEGLAGRVFMERRRLRVQQLAGLSGAPRPLDTARAPWLASEGFVAYVGMPLLAKGLVRGVLEVFHRGPLAPNAEWIDFLETLAEQAAIAVDNSALFADLQRSNIDLELAYDTTLEGWSRALDLRDKETEGHTQRVTDLTERLARAMGLGEVDLVHIRRGALLHDIGKMGIPDSILLKPGPLTDEEWAVMRKHPVYAYELLTPIPYLRPALDIPYSHHEKWDGTGYPRGLAGEQIPQAARVFAVVDVWDALRSDRPYRPAWPEQKVREHLRSLAGKHFDPRALQAFLRLLGQD